MTVTPKQAYDIGEAAHKRALSYAARTGTAIDLVVVRGADAKHEVKMTPGKLRAAILANLTPEEVEGLPLPGSRYNDGGEPNNNPDIFLYKDQSKGADAKPKEVSFYVAWADGTPEGANIVREIDWCKRIGKDNMKIDDIPQAWQDKYSNAKAIDERLDYLEGRRSTVRGNYKDAVRLIWQIDMVNELVVTEEGDDSKVIGGCTATMDTDGTSVLVEDRADPKKNWKYYSVGSFLKLNPRKASENGGTYHDLKATETRGTPKDKGGKGKTGVDSLTLNSVQTPASSDKLATVWLSYLDKAMNNKASAEYAELLKHLTSDGGKQACLTYSTIRDNLNRLFMIDAIKGIADAEKEKLRPAA